MYHFGVQNSRFPCRYPSPVFDITSPCKTYKQTWTATFLRNFLPELSDISLYHTTDLTTTSVQHKSVKCLLPCHCYGFVTCIQQGWKLLQTNCSQLFGAHGTLRLFFFFITQQNEKREPNFIPAGLIFQFCNLLPMAQLWDVGEWCGCPRATKSKKN